MATSVCVSRCQMLLKSELNRIGLRTLFTMPQDYKVSWSRRPRLGARRRASAGRPIHTSALHHPALAQSDQNARNDTMSRTAPTAGDDEITVRYHGGLPQITVPLPSRREHCRFTLRPVTNTVGDFLLMLRTEDRGVDRAACQTCSGVRIAASDSVEALLEQPFVLIINDRRYEVDPPPRERLTTEESADLAEVRDVVQRLYEALEVREQRTRVERDIIGRMEAVRMELQPMEQQKMALDLQSDTSTRYLVWLGLGLMGVQFGVLARLTWWEYSWDIMEPVTYFVTYGTTMMCYAYYVLTKQEPNMPDVRDRQYLITFHKKAKRSKFDVAKYNKMKEEMYELEQELHKLRDPIMLHTPRKPAQIGMLDAETAAKPNKPNNQPPKDKDQKTKC